MLISNLTFAIFLGLLSTASAVPQTQSRPTPPPDGKGGCHYQADSDGKECTFASGVNGGDGTSWKAAAGTYCEAVSKLQTPIKPGQEYPVAFTNQLDGFKNKDNKGNVTPGKQTFFGNYMIDSDAKPITPTQEECMNDMNDLFAQCWGFGGWIKRDYGTVFGECIDQNRGGFQGEGTIVNDGAGEEEKAYQDADAVPKNLDLQAPGKGF